MFLLVLSPNSKISKRHLCGEKIANFLTILYVSAFFLLIILYCKRIFRGEYTALQREHIPQEGGWDTGVGRSSSM